MFSSLWTSLPAMLECFFRSSKVQCALVPSSWIVSDFGCCRSRSMVFLILTRERRRHLRRKLWSILYNLWMVMWCRRWPLDEIQVLIYLEFLLEVFSMIICHPFLLSKSLGAWVASLSWGGHLIVCLLVGCSKANSERCSSKDIWLIVCLMRFNPWWCWPLGACATRFLSFHKVLSVRMIRFSSCCSLSFDNSCKVSLIQDLRSSKLFSVNLIPR